jgi:hypothetical protein
VQACASDVVKAAVHLEAMARDGIPLDAPITSAFLQACF